MNFSNELQQQKKRFYFSLIISDNQCSIQLYWFIHEVNHFYCSVRHQAHAICNALEILLFIMMSGKIKTLFLWIFYRILHNLNVKMYRSVSDWRWLKCLSDAFKWIKSFEPETLSFYNRLFIIIICNWHTIEHLKGLIIVNLVLLVPQLFKKKKRELFDLWMDSIKHQTNVIDLNRYELE